MRSRTTLTTTSGSSIRSVHTRRAHVRRCVPVCTNSGRTSKQSRPCANIGHWRRGPGARALGCGLSPAQGVMAYASRYLAPASHISHPSLFLPCHGPSVRPGAPPSRPVASVRSGAGAWASYLVTVSRYTHGLPMCQAAMLSPPLQCTGRDRVGAVDALGCGRMPAASRGRHARPMDSTCRTASSTGYLRLADEAIPKKRMNFCHASSNSKNFSGSKGCQSEGFGAVGCGEDAGGGWGVSDSCLDRPLASDKPERPCLWRELLSSCLIHSSWALRDCALDKTRYASLTRTITLAAAGSPGLRSG